MCILKSAEIDDFFFFLSARCGQRLLVEYQKSTERNTGSSIHGEKQQMGKIKAQKTAILLLNAHKYSRKLFTASITPQVHTSPDLCSRRRTIILQLEVTVFVTKQLTVKCLGTGPFPAQHSVAEARVRRKKRHGGWIPRWTHVSNRNDFYIRDARTMSATLEKHCTYESESWCFFPKVI